MLGKTWDWRPRSGRLWALARSLVAQVAKDLNLKPVTLRLFLNETALVKLEIKRVKLIQLLVRTQRSISKSLLILLLLDESGSVGLARARSR